MRIVSSDVLRVRTISAKRITGAGDAQCQPMTRSGRSVAAAIAAIEKPDVFDARIVAGGAAAVEVAEHADLQVEPFRDGFDHDVGRRGRPSNDDENSRRAERGVGLVAGELAALDRALEAVPAGRDVLAGALERGGVEVEQTVGYPAVAVTWAIPLPMTPAPTTPIRQITHRHSSSPLSRRVRGSRTVAGSNDRRKAMKPEVSLSHASPVVVMAFRR